MTNQLLTPRIEIDRIEGHEAIGERFEEEFTAFLARKKQQAAQSVVPEELAGTRLAGNPAFINQVAATIDDEALEERRFVFISVNKDYIESLDAVPSL